MKISTLVFALTVLRGVAGHSAFTNLWVDGTDQGDGTCVRMRMKPDVATDPIRDLKSNDMACGKLFPVLTSCAILTTRRV